MSNEGALMRYERQRDANARQDELCEPMVLDALMDALEAHEHDAEAQFIEWIADDFKAFMWAMLNPGERDRKEIIDNWRAKWVRETIDEHGWRSVNQLYGLGVE